MTKSESSFGYKVVSVVLVSLLMLIWSLSIWSYYWLRKPAEVVSVSHAVDHVTGKTININKGFRRIQEQHVGYTEIKYRFESGGATHVSSRVRIGESFLLDSEPMPGIKAGELMMVFIPYEGSRYSIIYPGLRILSLISVTAIVVFWFVFPKLINWFVLFVMRTLSIGRTGST